MTFKSSTDARGSKTEYDSSSGNIVPIVEPQMVAGGHISVQTAATGANFTAFASQTCLQVTIVNNTGTDIEVQQDGAGIALPILSTMTYTFYGIADASQLGVRRVDNSNTQVTVKARWEL